MKDQNLGKIDKYVYAYKPSFYFSKLGHCPMTLHYYFVMKQSDFELIEHKDREQNLVN